MRKLLYIFICVVGVFMAACSERTETNTATNTSSNSSEEKTTAKKAIPSEQTTISAEDKVNQLKKELIEASEKNDLNKVKSILKDVEKNIIKYDDTTALIWATKEGHTQVVKLLLEAGVKVDYNIDSDDTGSTALMWASQKGYIDIVKLLLAAGANVNKPSAYSVPAIGDAAMNGHIEVMKLLLEAGADVNLVDVVDNTSALMAAAYKGQTESIKVLLAAGADVNLKNYNGETALDIATKKGYTDIVEILKATGATTNLPKQEELNNALIKASRIGNYDEVNKLLAAGANVNAQDNSGETALMSIYPLDYSVPESNYKKIRDLLLGAGADINIADKRGRTALMNASFVGNVEDVKKLIEAGANVNAAESDGDTALIIASTGMDSEGYDDEKNKNQIVELLLNAGADQKEKALIAAIDSNFPVIVKTLLARGINTKGKSGEELLRVASQAGMLELVKMLLANKVNVNAVDEQGRTALLQATRPCGTGICDDRVGVAKALLKAGADVNLANKDGQTPLFYAIYSGDTEMVQLLLEAGADVTVKMKDGETVLQRAQKEEYNEIIKLLKAAGAKE